MEQSHIPAVPRPSQGQYEEVSVLSAVQSPPQYVSQPRCDPSNPKHSQLPLRPLHEPTTTQSFPGAPTTELPPIQPQHERSASGSHHTLPSLSSVTGGIQPPPEPKAANYWPSVNPLTAYYSPSYTRSADPPSRQDVEINAASPERLYDRRSASVSLDDPGVREAAEALRDLKAGTSYRLPGSRYWNVVRSQF